MVTGLAVFVMTATTAFVFRMTGAWPAWWPADLAMGASLGVAPLLVLAGLGQIATGRSLDTAKAHRGVVFAAGFLAAAWVWAIALAWVFHGGIAVL